MYDDQILDGSDDTTGGSTQIQRRAALKDTMEAAVLILEGLDRSSIIDLAKDQDYRELVHRFLSPLTSLSLRDAVDQANQALKNGLDEISRGLAGLFPVDDIPIVNPIRSEPLRGPLNTHHRKSPPQPHPATTTTAPPKPSVSPGPGVSLKQLREPPKVPPLTPLEKVQQDGRKMVTIHFLVGREKGFTTLKDVIDDVNEIIWKRVGKGEQRVVEGWMTKKKDIVLSCQSSLDIHYTWIDNLDLSHLWERGTVVHVRRGPTTAYADRLVDGAAAAAPVPVSRADSSVSRTESSASALGGGWRAREAARLAGRAPPLPVSSRVISDSGGQLTPAYSLFRR